MVILGHNLDDSLENIFSNIKKKQNYNNLFGMDLYSKEKDVHIARPLLKISKKQIIEFANEFYIPYTYDSTPSWSERGKLRDELIPFMNNFDPSILLGLIELTNNYKEIYNEQKQLFNTSIKALPISRQRKLIFAIKTAVIGAFGDIAIQQLSKLQTNQGELPNLKIVPRAPIYIFV